MANVKQVGLRLEPELWEKILAEAARQGISAAELVRRTMRRALKS